MGLKRQYLGMARTRRERSIGASERDELKVILCSDRGRYLASREAQGSHRADPTDGSSSEAGDVQAAHERRGHRLHEAR